MLRATLLGLHILLGLSAIGAGQALVRRPDGDALSFEKSWLEGSPFPDYRIPGLFLAAVIGGANLLSTLAQGKNAVVAPCLSLATGSLMVIWLAIQGAIIGYKHWSQLVWSAVFPTVAVLGALQLKRRKDGE